MAPWSLGHATGRGILSSAVDMIGNVLASLRGGKLLEGVDAAGWNTMCLEKRCDHEKVNGAHIRSPLLIYVILY